jgi:RNA polymerase sigma-70 factor, ECF subfamily
MEQLGNLLKSARSGDPESIEALVRSQIDRLYAMAFRVTGDGHLAEDVIQEVFIRILHGRSVCRRAEAAASWLARLTVGVALDQVRDRAARRRREEKYAAARERVASGAMGEGHMEANDLEILNEALASLSADGRACLWLHFAEGLNVREVAAHIGKGKSATANRIRQAANHLRTFLTKRGFALGMAAPIPDLLRGLPRPVSPPGLSEKILKAARLPSPASGVTRDWLATISTWGAAMLTGKHIAAVGIALSILVIAGWGGMKLLERPGAGGEAGPLGGPPPIARSEPSPAPVAPVGDRPAPAPQTASVTAPAENSAPEDEKPTLKGRILDLDDLPLSGSTANVRMKGWPPEQTLEVKADGDGAFVLEDLEAGSYTVGASDPRHSPGSREIEFPRETEVTLRLSLAAFVPARIFLLDVSAPLRNGEVTVSDGLGPEKGYSPAKVFETDGEGRTFIGPYSRSNDWGEHILTFQHGSFKAATRHVTVGQGAGPEAEIEVVLTNGITVKGALRNLQGATIAGVDIRWRKPGSDMSTQLICTTEARGRFEREGLEPGAFIASVMAVSPEFKIQQEVELGEDAIQEVNLTVDCLPLLEVRLEDRDGKPVSGIQVKYFYSLPGGSGGSQTEPTDEQGLTTIRCIQTGLLLRFELDQRAPGTISGSYTASPKKSSIVLRLDPQIELGGEVVDADQRPAAMAEVSVVAMEHLGMLSQFHTKRTESGSDGRFEVVLPPGSYRVTAQAGKKGAAAARVSIEEGAPPEWLRLELRTEGCIQVHVSASDGKPMAGVGVQCALEKSRGGDELGGRSDDDGWVSFPAGPGTYSISTYCPPWLYIPEALTGIRGGCPPVELQFLKREERTVSGVVLHDGKPVPKAKVGYWRVKGGWAGDMKKPVSTCDEQGKFEITGIYERSIRVLAWGPGFAMARSELIEVPDRGTMEGVTVLSLPGKDFRGKLLDQEGKPFPNLTVRIYVKPENDPFMTMAITDPEGLLRIPNLPPGEYVIQTYSPDSELVLREDFSWNGQAAPPEFQLKWNRPPK